MNKLNEYLYRIKRIISAKEDGYVFEAEEYLAKIVAMQDPASIKPLIMLLDDSEEAHELMYSIVHMIEAWDYEHYYSALLESIEALWEHAPEWAQLLHVRIMNSPASLESYFAMLGSASSEVRTVVQNIYKSIPDEWPELKDKVDPIVNRIHELS